MRSISRRDEMSFAEPAALPVAASAGRNPECRFYTPAFRAWGAWGVTLYLLGFLLATQVAQIHSLTA